MVTGDLAPDDGWDIRDADFRKSLMKMIYRKFQKTRFVSAGFSEWDCDAN